jgi:catechol 2,3-dioxygenase-like lactoylglutathione lyase family enzyme
MIRLQRLGHVLITVRNLERSKAFYIDLLGFRVLEEDPDHGGLFLTLGDYGNTLDLFESRDPDAGHQPRATVGNPISLGVRHTAFAVATERDLREAYEALVAAGVEIHKTLDHVSQKSVYFYDPDGNLLEIVWERDNPQAIFARGRGDGDRPLSFEQ